MVFQIDYSKYRTELDLIRYLLEVDVKMTTDEIIEHLNMRNPTPLRKRRTYERSIAWYKTVCRKEGMFIPYGKRGGDTSMYRIKK